MCIRDRYKYGLAIAAWRAAQKMRDVPCHRLGCTICSHLVRPSYAQPCHRRARLQGSPDARQYRTTRICNILSRRGRSAWALSLIHIFNTAFAWLSVGMASGVLLRFSVGLCLAGIYPLGMKLVVSWVPERAGVALAWLVGMLTLGTALPHGIRFFGESASWQLTLTISSCLALLAAVDGYKRQTLITSATWLSYEIQTKSRMKSLGQFLFPPRRSRS